MKTVLAFDSRGHRRFIISTRRHNFIVLRKFSILVLGALLTDLEPRRVVLTSFQSLASALLFPR